MPAFVPPAPMTEAQFNASLGAVAQYKSRPADPGALLGSKPFALTPNSPQVPWIFKFVTPLDMRDMARQTVNLLMFQRPGTIQQTPNSNPPLLAQYFTPPPINAANLGAGSLMLQQQLGNVAIQGAQLTTQASNFFGG